MTQDISAEETLAAEASRYAAQTGNDFAAMERLFGADLVYIHSSALRDDKASYIESMRSGAVRYRVMQRGDTQVRTFGPVGILTGQARFEVTARGQDMVMELMFHAVWVKRASGPQFVSWQATRLPAK